MVCEPSDFETRVYPINIVLFNTFDYVTTQIKSKRLSTRHLTRSIDYVL